MVAVLLAAALVASATAGRFPLWLGSSAAATDSPHQPAATASRDSPSPSARPAPSSPAPQPPSPALSAAQLAGQRVIYSYGGLRPPQSLLQLIRHGEAAGVIFFSQNFSSDAQLAGVIAELDQADAAPTNPVRKPLLLMTDQEGGIIRRLPGAPLLSERQIAASSDPPAAAANAGRTAGLNLRGLGLDVNLAPVLDVYRQPGDFDDQFQRS